MNRQAYRAQVDAVSFSPDFRERTVARLVALAEEREKKTVKKLNWKTGLVAAAIAAALSVMAYAGVVMLRPQDVARHVGNETLAAAFEGESAIEVNETKTLGDYDVTFMGMVSGEGLSRVESLAGGVARDKTYAILSYARTDGTAIADSVPELTVSPLVEGYRPWLVNAWTLGGGASTFAQEGIFYYLFECDNVEPFADHTVYLAVYPGTHAVPSAELFAFDEATGAIDAKGEAAMFTLPIDAGKADPQRAQAIVDGLLRPQPMESAAPVSEPPDGPNAIISAD